MATFHEVDGFDEFVKTIETLKETAEPIFVYFAGSHDDNGKSWCPDCEEGKFVILKPIKEMHDAQTFASAYPIVSNVMKTTAPKNAHFVRVQVGDRETWKDRHCIFRKSSLTRLTMLPTMQRWGSPFILREDECKRSSLIEMLLVENV